ncbi:hypothetical protein NEAUS03_1236 [Nematocida ausubeli]|nr:hypothetical protein NEAUS03_1236 [Nematocida ausubeli]
MISRIVLSLMMMQSILTRINMEDIKTVSETFVGEKQDVIINPMGPLNLQRGYIVNRGGYMYNKRFYSPEIDTDYGFCPNGITTSEEKGEVNFVRTPVNDSVYKDLDTTTPEGKYLSTYHTHLLRMFPSVNGDLSIEIDRPNAFTNFLRAEHVKKDAKYILAALLLLSEGVDIKIAVESTEEKKKLVIKSKTCEEKVFVDVEMHTEGIDPVTNEHSDSIYQSEAAEIVDFYIECRDNPLLKKGGIYAIPVEMEVFISGNFLNNAAFLIQTYIYEFIDSAESYESFVNAVHELLVDQVVEKENPAPTKEKENESRIFDELFLSKDALSENIKYIESFCDFVQAGDGSVKIPFKNDSQLPIYTRVPQCKLDKSGFESNQALYYSDCVESALLGLFCSLAYNQATRKYKTRYMGEGISKELKNFFKKYPNRVEIISSEMHKEWSKVVACLNNDKIDYKQNRNGLISGVGNIFLAISEIIGQREKGLELVESIENACRKGKLNDDLESKIKDNIKSIIRSLSPNRDVKVHLRQMRLGTRSDGKTDLLAEIVIVYIFNKEECEFSLNITPGYANLSLCSCEEDNLGAIAEEYKEIEKTYSGLGCYMGFLMIFYAAIELNCLSIYMPFFPMTANSIKDTMMMEPKEICKVFLLGKFVFNTAKITTIKFFMDDMMEKEPKPIRSLIRFAGNVLGSMPLNDEHTCFGLMMSLPNSREDIKEYYPRFLSEEPEPTS